MRLWVQYLASLSGLRIQRCYELWCRLQTWLRSGVAVALAKAGSCSCKQTPSQGTSVCCGCGPKKTKDKKKKKKAITFFIFILFYFLVVPMACRSSWARDWTLATGATWTTAVTILDIVPPTPKPSSLMPCDLLNVNNIVKNELKPQFSLRSFNYTCPWKKTCSELLLILCFYGRTRWRWRIKNREFSFFRIRPDHYQQPSDHCTRVRKGKLREAERPGRRKHGPAELLGIPR